VYKHVVLDTASDGRSSNELRHAAAQEAAMANRRVIADVQ
jgi:hypothetical protein